MHLRAAAGEFRLRILKQAPLRPQRDHDQLYAQRQHALCALLRAAAPEELRLLVADFDDIRLRKAPEDLLLRLLLRFPQRGAVIGVVGDELAVRFCVLCRAVRRASGRFVGQRKRAEVEHAGGFQHGRVDLLPAQLRVRAGLAREGERAVAVRVEGHERKRRERVGADQNAARVDPGAVHRAGQQMAEGVVADLGQKRGLFSVRAQRGEKIAGRAAGVGGKRGIAVFILCALREVDEQLTQCDDVIHSLCPPVFFVILP